MTENRTTATYPVVLTSPPGGAVTVSVASSDNTDVTVTPAMLTFTGGMRGNWNTAQVATVRAAGDGDGAEDTATLTHPAAAGSQDPGYTFLVARPRESVAVTVTDNDAPGLVVDMDPGTPGGRVTTGSSALAVTEAASAEYTLALNTTLSGPVTVHVTSNTGAATVGPGTLTFAAGAYWVGHAVNVRLPGATGGDPPVRYTLTGLGTATDLTLPAGLTYEPPERDTGTGLYPHGGRIVGTPTEARSRQ